MLLIAIKTKRKETKKSHIHKNLSLMGNLGGVKYENEALRKCLCLPVNN
jgi:hypothetical protein